MATPAPGRRIAFRLELGGSTGWGHLARCAALAEEMARRGWTCTLWTDGDAGVAPDDLRAPFHEVAPAGPAWSRNAPASDCFVVDWYGATDGALTELRATAARPLLVIDDEGTRRLEAAHIVLNARLGLRTSSYAPAARALLGESFALLRAGLQQPRKITAPWAPEVRPILVMLGGTDPRGLTGQVLEVMAGLDAAAVTPVVVGGTTMRQQLEPVLRRFAAPQWLERIDASTLAGWAAVCRGAVSACGGTLYELAALGLPFVGVIAADNQRAFAAAVAESWRMPVVDGASDFRSSLRTGLRTLLRSETSAGPYGGIDGRGASRVADVLESAR